MNKKYTFLELCESYHKIEIPIIQRDYAQGRETEEVERIRIKFIDNFLITSLIENKEVELDFVYGSILTEVNEDLKLKTFIPLDGQQRLTTLFLLHYFLGIKEGRLAELFPYLVKFTYETRPSAHDFCKQLLEFDTIKVLEDLRFEIVDSVWFNEEWLNDPTVSSMLKVLDVLAKNELLKNTEQQFVNNLLDKNKKSISFYFTDLDQFGLTESLYIRMNARGKMLTDFENFKSEFFKIIRYDIPLLEEVKTKIEYDWVNKLWDYRKEDSFVIDEPFMKYLHFITEMLYYKDAPFRSNLPYESDFLSFKVLNSIYSNKENLNFLIYSLDQISELSKHDFKLLWSNNEMISIKTILADIIEGSSDINKLIILYNTLVFSYHSTNQSNFEDFIRVVRNLIVNTNDNSRREWPRLLESIKSLLTDNNVYKLLATSSNEIKLTGFNVNQRKEEVFKAKLITTLPESKELIATIEDDDFFRGDITNILKTSFTNTEADYESIELENLQYDQVKINELEQIYLGYKEISNNYFNSIWGNLINSGLYTQTRESRLIYDDNYSDHPAILEFSKGYINSGMNIEVYIEKIERDYILELSKTYSDFSKIRTVKDQLYIYYIIHKRVYNKTYDTFFKNSNYNFGWLLKEKGYKTYFTEGIENCVYFPDTNPVFQVYNQQFRYNLGLNESNTLDIEIIGGKKNEPFKKIITWAEPNNV
ncbi:DUF262 domain-containing protein [Myroides marinus]|uniref:DUF262 domain-containing protein n=1 Tax=Myroides marinus TaxID=703342 RepID=UPI0025775F92|nr:DUF262 domain-containing protein [Myroides marinus]MDM1354657.1 DUF262 domain-containing protein [Myroides marinus]MDM1366138.1 DUF262 domain-containing protein [Myroides marinus]MDM1533688.1 DUF262 domain-containing protein [Myroides marinus]MDM1540652.1 DUF262 domain-containing protein [Myroides marinus]